MSSHPWTWPATPPRRKNTCKRLALRLEDWPAADRSRWEQAIRSTDLFDEPSPAAHLRPRTLKTLVDGYGRWLGYLQRTTPALLDRSPKDRLTSERIEAFCRALAETNRARSGAAILRAVRQVLHRIAPEQDWQWLLALAKRIELAAVPRSKAENLRMSDELYQLGFQLMNGAARVAPEGSRVRSRDAIAYRDGLMIALLAVDPIRRSNFAGLRLGTTLICTGSTWAIVLQANETKGGEPLEYPVPPRLGERIDVYLQRFKPAIYGSGQHDGVWASAKGCPMLGGAIYDAVCRRTTAAFGRPVWLHLFRTAAATFWSVESPDSVMGSKDLLGHRRFDTTATRYVESQSVKASQRYREILFKRLLAADRLDDL